MTREEATALLESGDTRLRLKAARYFAMNAVNDDARLIKIALHQETVPWIRRALERSLERAARGSVAAEKSENMFADPPERLVAELRAKAIEEVAGTIIHELATIVGSLQLAAPRDVPNYEVSRTAALVNSLVSLLGGIRGLKAAARRANYSECDLAAECREACVVFSDVGDVFRFAGPSPFLVEIDPDLFKLAMNNIIKNAVEALNSLPDGVERVITLNWGKAGTEYWVAVLDSGTGFERDPRTLIEFGQSTKEKGEHSGFGLATAKQAMQAMEGDIYPSNARAGGALVELRWFGGNENSIN